MKLLILLLCFLLTCPVFSQNNKDSVGQQDEMIIISTENGTVQDTDQLKILRDTENESIQKTHSELFSIGAVKIYKINETSAYVKQPFAFRTLQKIQINCGLIPDNLPELKSIPKEQFTAQDTNQMKIIGDTENEPKQKTVSELFIIGKGTYKKGGASGSANQMRAFKGHWSGFSYGFVNFTEVPDNMKGLELDWGHSFAMQFNLLKYSINLVPRNNFGLVTGVGLEYQRLRFNNDNFSIAKKDGDIVPVIPTDVYPNIKSITRSTFKNLYLTIPLMMEVQFPAKNTNRMYVSAGFMGGLRMHSKTKIVYKDQDGDKVKKKGKGNFNMVPFKADAIARIGYRGVNVWGSYTLTNMFKNSDIPDIHAYTIGLGVTF